MNGKCIGLWMALAAALCTQLQASAQTVGLAAGPDTTYRLRVRRVADTVVAHIRWARNERDRADLALDVLDMRGDVVRTYKQRLKLAPNTDAQARFVLNPAQDLGLDSATFYYALTSNLSCNCEDQSAIVLPAHPDSYTWPEPGLEVSLKTFRSKTFVLLRTANVATNVRLTLPPGHPRWRLADNGLDLLPGQEAEVEILGMAPGEPLKPADIGVEWRK